METLGGYAGTVGLAGNPLIANLEFISGTRRCSTSHHVQSPLLRVSKFAGFRLGAGKERRKGGKRRTGKEGAITPPKEEEEEE